MKIRNSNCKKIIWNENKFRKPQNISLLCGQAIGDKIFKIVGNINIKICPGIDGISALDIKLIAGKICVAIANLVNVSLWSAIYPDEVKIGKTRPIHKDGSPNGYSKYCHITMLPTVDKVIEKYFSQQIYDFYSENNILSEIQ